MLNRVDRLPSSVCQDASELVVGASVLVAHPVLVRATPLDGAAQLNGNALVVVVVGLVVVVVGLVVVVVGGGLVVVVVGSAVVVVPGLVVVVDEGMEVLVGDADAARPAPIEDARKKEATATLVAVRSDPPPAAVLFLSCHSLLLRIEVEVPHCFFPHPVSPM